MSFLPSFVKVEVKARLTDEFADATKHPNTTAAVGMVFRDGYHYVRYRVGFDGKTETALSERIMTSVHEDFHPYETLFEHLAPAGTGYCESFFAGLSEREIAEHDGEDCAEVVKMLLTLPERIAKARAL